ncbi:NmrA-like family protein [Ophiocordyceps sinensis CO18]|uniref:NmrA-like family protein n=1 Tax=Ophiocordyceps sinensis (strain Co18 / CGMCC 3.14243) TaxID=911162 RepID=T5AP71_OPHSC|nr:NmrA-like family protein [Ophiocordyceps sinensis CO18]
MASTFLVVGATGNTGRSVVETLSSLLPDSTFSGYRILALTRSSSGAVAQKLAKLPGVEVVEKNWVDINDDWLRENMVVRAFIASHNDPNQFAEESTFHLAALNAGVEYVVRISTTHVNVRPDFRAYYPRTHWAIETLLSTPEFQRLKWTSLQPNIFSSFYFGSAAEFVKSHRKTGKLDTLWLMAAKDSPVAVIDPDDVGSLAAHLLLEKDVAVHNKAKYVLNGPEDITGQQVLQMVEKHIGTQVKDVCYKDASMVDRVAANSQETKSVILSIKYAIEAVWGGKCTASTTSKEVLRLAPAKRTPAEMFEALLG